MQIAKELKNEIKEAQKLRLPWWGVLCIIICALPIYWLFDHFGRVDLDLPILNCVGMLGLAIYIKRKMRRQAWFWFTMIIIAALHVPLILFVPWTTKWVPALAIACIDSVDLIVILAILSAVGRYFEGPETAER